jgi:hypothetical protein
MRQDMVELANALSTISLFAKNGKYNGLNPRNPADA